jgi:hypothetical protein
MAMLLRHIYASIHIKSLQSQRRSLLLLKKLTNLTEHALASGSSYPCQNPKSPNLHTMQEVQFHLYEHGNVRLQVLFRGSWKAQASGRAIDLYCRKQGFNCQTMGSFFLRYHQINAWKIRLDVNINNIKIKICKQE